MSTTTGFNTEFNQEASIELAQETQALQRMQSAPPTLAGVNIEALLAKAVDANSAVDVLERLAVMRREMKAEAAKEAFDSAMAQFQAECPVISKDSAVHQKNSTQVRYRYATIEAIVTQTKGMIQKHGFSYRVTAKVEDKFVTAICKVVHSLGHSEESEFKVPIDPTSFMNEAQKFASALTFAKRYAFCNAFGILTGDTDDDAQGSDPEHASGQGKRTPPPQQQPAPGPAARAPAAATAASSALAKLPTAKFRERAIEKLVTSPAHYKVLLEFLQKAGALMPNETDLKLWPLQHVPASEPELEALRKALAGFEAGEPAKIPFYHQEAMLSDGAQPELLRAAPAKTKKPIEVPRDPDAGDQSTAPTAIDPTWEKVTGNVAHVSVKKGTNSRGPWTCYGIKIGEDWYNSFSKRVGQIAQGAEGREVDLYYSANEKGKTAEHIEA